VRAIVTGGAGFVGSHLVDALIAAGHEVVAIDDLSTGSAANLAHLDGNAAFRFVRHDVREPYEVECDVLYNLACPASPVHYQRDPVRTTMTSINGALHGLELARRHHARFLQASTSEIYGDPIVHPQHEDYWGNVHTVGPRACYDEGKRCAESLCADFQRVHGVTVRIARIFNTYGPRMAVGDGRVVSNFIVQALRGEDITIYGDGSQTRSFQYIDDLVDGILALLATDVSQPVNLGNPTETTVLELAELVRELTGTRSPIDHLPLPQDDPRRRKPDIDRATRLLGWRPVVPLREGLKRTIDAFPRA
jgi:UDP-glucuronate decarboxylase